MWNYRIIENDGVYAIHECFYDQNKKPIKISALPKELIELSEELLKEDYQLIGKAFNRPILKWEDFNNEQ